MLRKSVFVRDIPPSPLAPLPIRTSRERGTPACIGETKRQISRFSTRVAALKDLGCARGLASEVLL